MKFTKITRNILLTAALAVPAATLPLAQANAEPVFISVHVGPPALPVYVQPVCPGDGYIWTPGYWAWDDASGYYWVPGTWVMPPTVGVLWTPGYWGWGNGAYLWHAGYWGPHVGFYGGINYGFGYGGVGFDGGYWGGGHFFYNTAVVRFGGGWHPNYVYSRPVTIVNRTTIAFNGGHGGIDARPSGAELQAEHEQHMQPTGEQMNHQSFAQHDRSQFASVNHGRPGVPAAATPASFHANPSNAAAAAHAGPNARQANQDQRIANGLRSGQMTSGEAARADRTQSNIDRQTAADRAANGGRLTGQERQQINGEQNRASRQIYNDNHNANTVRPNAVDNREANQQARTAQGLRSGQMTSNEAARTNRNQANVDRQVHNDRTANGGAMNQQQRQQVNREQNRNSGQIHNENHNAAARPPAHEGQRH